MVLKLVEYVTGRFRDPEGFPVIHKPVELQRVAYVRFELGLGA
jgi:hypothetical protein